MKLDHESIFIYPTDTVWGIGASIYSENAKKRISEIKGSAENKPLSIMFTDVETVLKSFNLPKEFTREWLKTYFTLESTLGVPLKDAVIEIPAWVYGGSDIVSIRCLENSTLKEISSHLNAPFFTTSLNITGEAPIQAYGDALAFHKNIQGNPPFFFGNKDHDLSGRSSTIVFIRNGKVEIIREGLKINEIKKHLELVGFVTA